MGSRKMWSQRGVLEVENMPNLFGVYFGKLLD